MELILWRHADAEDPGPKGDLARELTKKGRRQAEKMAAWLRPRLEGRWTILVSPAARAVQTVEPLGLGYEVREALDPSSFAERVLREAGWPDAERVLVVGHQPTLGEIVARLLGARGGEVAVRKGAVWWLATRDRGEGLEVVVKAMMAPEMLEDPAKGAK